MRLNVEFSSLADAVRRMGAETVHFNVESQAAPLDPIDINLESGIEINIQEVDTDNGLLSYKGRQILAYIQDHGSKAQEAIQDGQKGKKFHVADCETLEAMRERGRFDRYVVTNRLDGIFFIAGYEYPSRKPIEGETELWVCKNCLKLLNYKGANESRRHKHQVAEEFDIGDFFLTYSSFFTQVPRRQAGNGAEEAYTKDWPQVAARVKAQMQMTCEQCGINLQNHKNLLHVHHCNGVKGDNRRENLKALCVSCHRLQPDHGHMHVPLKHTQTINRLRRDQGLLQRSGWDEAVEYCDPAVRGLLEAVRNANGRSPEVGLDITDATAATIGTLELAWPTAKVGVAIGDEDWAAAEEAGWEMWEMVEALYDLDGFLTAIRRRRR